VAVNRETIEIQLAGADRVRNLTRDLNAAQVAAANLSGQLEETAERLQALGVEQRTFNANTRATGGQRRLVRGAQQNPGFTAGLSRAEAAAIRDDLRERAASIDEQLRGRALESRALRQRIRSVTQQQRAEQARLREVGAQQQRLVRAQDMQIGLIEDSNQFLRRELGVSRRRSRERTTATRRARYEQTISRIGGEQNLGATSRQRIGELRQAEARVSQQLNTLDEAAAASRRATLVQRESLAERRFRERSGFASELQDLRAGLRAGGSRAAFVTTRLDVRQRVQESESNFAQTAARITQESNANERAFEAARRSLTTELGSIAEGIREVLRTDKGAKAGDTRQRRLFERAAELERAGATQGPAIGTGRGARVISPSTLVDVRSRLNRASGFFAQGDVESANRLLDSAEKTLSTAERDLNTRKKITRENEAQSKSAASLNQQREKALDGEVDRSVKLQSAQRKLNELRGGGAAGPGVQRAQALIGRLPGLEQAGNFAQFDRDAKRASSALLDVASASRLQTRASKDVTTAENRRVAATRTGEDLEFKLRELTTAGVDPRQLAASVGGKPAQLQKILGRAFSEASFGDPEKAAELLDIAGRRITVLGRELGLNKKIASEEEKRLNAAKQGFPSSPVRGTKEMPGSPAWQAANFDKPGVAQMRLNKALGSGDVLLKKLETLRLKGVDTVQEELNLQNTLNTARNSGFQLSKNNLSALENSIKSAELFVSTEQKLTTELEKQFRLRKIAAGGSGPIRRDTLTGKVAGFSDLGITGRVQLGGRGADSAINQIVQAFNRSVGVQGGRPGQQLGLNDLAKVSKASARELELLSETLSMVRAGMRSTDKGFDQIGDTIARVNRQIQRQDPDADFLTRRLGVRGGRAASEGLIGGAFPLLFGQGVGAAAGGALGGGLGGFAGGMLGFGLSLAGTAIGTAIDGVIQAAQDTGEMLRDLTGNFDQIKEAGLLASRGQERLVEKLIEAGNKTAAYSIIQAELNNKLGVEGVSKLRAAADAGERMQRAMAELGKQIEIFVAGPLADFLNRIAGFIERANLENQVSAALAAAPAEARALAQAQLSAAQRAQVQQNQVLPLGQRVGAELGNRLGIFNPFGSPSEATYGLPRFGDLPQDALQNVLSGLRAATPPASQTDEEKRSAATRDAETSLADAQRDLQVASKELESIDLLKGFQQQLIAVRREQEDIDRQSFEIRRDYERQIADIRENVENKVLQISQDNKRKEIDLIIKQGEIRQAQFRNAALALQGALAGDELASSLADAVTTYLSSQLSAQDQIEQRRLQFELEISNQQIEVEKFKGDIAKSVSRLNLDTAERIQSINFGIARRNEDASRNNFELEKRIAELKIKASQRELFLQRVNQASEIAQLETVVREQPFNQQAAVVLRARQAGLAETDRGISDLVRKLDEIKATPAPPLIRPIAPVGARGVSTAGVDTAFARGAALSRQFQQLEDQLAALAKGGDVQQLLNELDRIALSSGKQLAGSLSDAIKEYGVATGDLQPIIDGVNQSYAELAAGLAKRGIIVSPELQKALDQYKKAQILLEELALTQRFYTETIQGYSNEVQQLKGSIGDLLGPASEYEKQLQRINESGGLEVNPEENKTLLEAAKNVDRLREKLQALNALNDLAAGWTDSFIEFNKQLLKGEGLVKSLKSFLEGTADRALDVILEFTLRPMQEKMFKDLASFLFEAEKNPMLKPLDSINENTNNTFKELGEIKDILREAMPKAQPIDPAAANGIVPGPAASPWPGSGAKYNVPGSQQVDPPAGFVPGQGQVLLNPQSSLPSSMMNGVGGPDLPLAIEKVPGIQASEIEATLKEYELFAKTLNERLGEIKTPAKLEEYRNKVLDFIASPKVASDRPVAQGAAIRNDASAMLNEAIANRLSQLQQTENAGSNPITAFESSITGLDFQATTLDGSFYKLDSTIKAFEYNAGNLSKSFGELATQSYTNAEMQAAAGKSVKTGAEDQNESLKKFGQVAGASIQTLSGVAMAVGGAQMIGKGGTYNTLMGIAGIFGGISSVASGIGGFGKTFGWKGFAKGGRPDPFSPAWVGEEGMELWVPDRPGTIISNDNLDDVYVPGLDDSNSPPVPAGRYSRQDSGGFSAESSYDQSGAPLFYGRSAPYQRSETTREIDRLERVASNPRDLPPIKYETQQINQYTFVTPDQLEESNARTAKAARAQTIRELADSRKTRNRVGL
jgi:hypothetical protein